MGLVCLSCRNFILTVFSPRFWTRQCRYTSFPNCVVSFTCVCSSSKNGSGSWCVVVSSPSSSSPVSSSRFSSTFDEMLCQNLGTWNPNGGCCCLGTENTLNFFLKCNKGKKEIYQSEGMRIILLLFPLSRRSISRIFRNGKHCQKQHQ